MASNNLIITIFLIFCFFILETFEKTEISKRILELRKLQNSEEGDDDTNSPSTTSSSIEEGTYSRENSTEYKPDKSKASRTILGFGNYKEDRNSNKITFIVYVKKIKNDDAYEYLYFTIVFYKNMRGLDESNSINVNVKAKLKESVDNDYYDIYNVDVDTYQKSLDIDEINSMTIKNDFCFSSNTDECDEYDKINKINNINIEIKKSDIDIYYSQYSSNNNKYMDILTGNIEKSPNSEYQYKIRFYIERSINTNLDGARIDASNIISTRLRNLDSSNEKYLFLSETEEEQLYIKQDYEPSGPKYYTLKGSSDSGLSGGAIAGIIIASIVVLIAVAFVFIYLNKRPKLPILHSSAIEFYNSSSSMQN